MSRKPRKEPGSSAKESISIPKAKKGRAEIEQAVQLVEQYIASLGLNPNEQRLTELDSLGWMANVGSAVVLIYINEYEDLVTLRVVSPILYLPLNNILRLYRSLLEKNFTLISCAFAVHEDKIGLVSERSIVGLGLKEVEETIARVGVTADDMDEELATEFGARMFTMEDA